jgi:hypothetical protein
MEQMGFSCRGRREDAFVNERLPQEYAIGQVDLQDSNRHAPDGCLSDKVGSLPAKMAIPLVPTGIEERSELLRDGVKAGDVRPLVIVARETSEDQVARAGCSSVFLRNHVIDFVSKPIVILMNLTVFASGKGPLPNQVFQLSIHDQRPEPLDEEAFVNLRRALDFRVFGRIRGLDSRVLQQERLRRR